MIIRFPLLTKFHYRFATLIAFSLADNIFNSTFAQFSVKKDDNCFVFLSDYQEVFQFFIEFIYIAFIFICGWGIALNEVNINCACIKLQKVQSGYGTKLITDNLRSSYQMTPTTFGDLGKALLQQYNVFSPWYKLRLLFLGFLRTLTKGISVAFCIITPLIIPQFFHLRDRFLSFRSKEFRYTYCLFAYSGNHSVVRAWLVV